MRKILEVNVDDNGYGGVYSFVLNILENISSCFQVDLCAFEKFEKKEHIEYIESFGGKVFYCGHGGNLIAKQIGSFKKLFHLAKKGKYDVIHIHSDVSYKLFIYALICKWAGAGKILIHSHSTGVEGKHRKIKLILQKFFKPMLPWTTDNLLACSEKAAKWMYPQRIITNNNYTIINNGISIQKFEFNQSIRSSKRRELELHDDDFAVCHIGRFSYPKNQSFLIDIFHEIIKQKASAKLILIGGYVGDPHYLDEAKAKVSNLGLDKSVLFLGIRNDVPSLLQAMDCFVLPSYFEGLPIVGIEAQAAGLPCFFSDTITSEVGITSLVHFISLDKPPEFWARIILKDSKTKCRNMRNDIINSGYDIDHEIKKLEEMYE